MTYWRATVERPNDDGGWTVVGIFGTPETPGSGSSRYIHGDTALDAAQLVLDHVWPVNLAEFNERKDPGRWRDEHQARTGIADHRITVDVDESNRWSVGYGRPVPEPFTVTVAELRLAEIRTQAAALADARVKLQELTEQVRKARGDVRHFTYLKERAAENAACAGVPEPDVTKASRTPRQPRKKKA